MNWKYILIVFFLAAVVGGGTFWLAEDIEELPATIEFPKIEKQRESENEVVKKDEEVKEPEQGKNLIEEKIEQGKEFLLRMEDEEKHGFHKYYYALKDEFEERLHTVYSASIIYTLLKIYDFDGDQRILEKVPEWGEFLLSMQSQEGKTKGAFHYSYYLDYNPPATQDIKEQKFVVGTAALSIFTLLDLYQRTREVKYLESAKLAGDWLLTMQQDDGVMKSHQRYRDGEWYYGTKESLLYNGQVLSALSRLYNTTQEEKYKNSAERIAKHFEKRVGEEGCFLGDEYRSANPISSAWVVMSLLDFYKVNPEEKYKEIILNCSRELVGRQMTETTNPLYQGRWNLAFSTSGNGWLAEVMMEMYHFCKSENMAGCQDYKTAVIKVIGWLMQFTYSEENSAFLPNPQLAIGGIFWGYDDKYVRTDSVCHALNSYVGIIDYLEE